MSPSTCFFLSTIADFFFILSSTLLIGSTFLAPYSSCSKSFAFLLNQPKHRKSCFQSWIWTANGWFRLVLQTPKSKLSLSLLMFTRALRACAHRCKNQSIPVLDYMRKKMPHVHYTRETVVGWDSTTKYVQLICDNTRYRFTVLLETQQWATCFVWILWYLRQRSLRRFHEPVVHFHTRTRRRWYLLRITSTFFMLLLAAWFVHKIILTEYTKNVPKKPRPRYCINKYIVSTPP